MATDLETGKEVALAKGSRATAIRASLAVSAAFDPVEIDGRLLLDGGLANNVPVSVARGMGAEVVIVVAVGSGLVNRDQISTALDVRAAREFSCFVQQRAAGSPKRTIRVCTSISDRALVFKAAAVPETPPCESCRANG